MHAGHVESDPTCPDRKILVEWNGHEKGKCMPVRQEQNAPKPAKMIRNRLRTSGKRAKPS